MTSLLARRVRWLALACLISAGLATTGCLAPAPRVQTVEPQVAEDLAGSPFDPSVPPRYVLCPADELLVRFPDDPNLNTEVCVRSDGKITLPHVGDVAAAQRSPDEVTAELTQRYQSVLKNVSLAVIVMKEAGRRVFIGGEVRTPGVLSLFGGQTLVQALFEAGGITGQGRADEVVVVRVRPGDATYLLKANVERILSGEEADVRLEPFDIVFVPETAITKLNRFVDQYLTRMLPGQVSFPFTTELHTQTLRVISNSPVNPGVSITR